VLSAPLGGQQFSPRSPPPFPNLEPKKSRAAPRRQVKHGGGYARVPKFHQRRFAGAVCSR
jgi:hypothetical protein